MKESQLLQQNTSLSYGCISYIFLSNRNTVFFSSHELHYIFPLPLVQNTTLSMYTANKIAKDQYVCTATKCTNNNNLTMTPDHMYMKGSPGTLFIHP
jgi:hypothetical protein